MEVCKQREEDIIDFVDHELLTNGTREKILEVLQQQIDVNCITENGDTVLHSILRNQKLVQKDVVEFLTLCLTRGVDLNKRGRHEETALHLAVERRMKEAVNCLLEFAADIYVVDQSGNGIAHFFIEDEYEKMKMAMLHPLMNTPENRKITENCSLDFTSFLLDVGVDFDRKNEGGKSALDFAIIYNLPHLLPVLLERTKVKDYKKLIEILLKEISLTSSSYSPDEIFASKYDAILRLLLDRVKSDANNNYGLTLLSDAIKNKREMSCIQTMINYFLIRCDDVDIAENMFAELTGTCAYWSDSDRDYFSTVIIDLLICSVNINEIEFRKRLISNAIKSKNIWQLEFLRDMGMIFVDFELQEGKNLIATIAEQMDYNDESTFEFCKRFVKLLMCSGYDLNDRDRYGKTALQTAIDSGQIPMVRILVDSGVDLNRHDRCCRTALHQALMIGKPIDFMAHQSLKESRSDRLSLPRPMAVTDQSRLTILYSNATEDEARIIVKLLVKGGVDVNARDSMFNTPLHITVLYDDVDMMKLLLEGKVNVNAKDNEGNTPLQLIFVLKEKLKKSRDMMMLLLEKGACTNVRNMHMETPLELALLFDPGLAEELLRYNADIEDANVRQLLRELHDDELDREVRRYYTVLGTVQCMRRHWMKLMAANLPLDDEYKEYMTGNFGQEYYNDCLTEIEKLKKVLIDGQQSLYDFLHMHIRRRCTYLQDEKLQQMVESSNLSKNFPEISVLIMASYQEANVFKKREKLSFVMADIFFKMYNVSYENVAEKIVGYLREDDFIF